MESGNYEIKDLIGKEMFYTTPITKIKNKIVVKRINVEIGWFKGSFYPNIHIISNNNVIYKLEELTAY